MAAWIQFPAGNASARSPSLARAGREVRATGRDGRREQVQRAPREGRQCSHGKRRPAPVDDCPCPGISHLRTGSRPVKKFSLSLLSVVATPRRDQRRRCAGRRGVARNSSNAAGNTPRLGIRKRMQFRRAGSPTGTRKSPVPPNPVWLPARLKFVSISVRLIAVVKRNGDVRRQCAGQPSQCRATSAPHAML